MKIPVSPPPLHELVARVAASPDGVRRYAHIFDLDGIGPAPGGEYRHWDTFRQVAPPAGHTVEEAWLAVKLARQSLYRRLPLASASGKPFVYALPNPALEMLHRVDRDAGGSIRGEAQLEQVTGTATRDTYLFKSLVEEAITSSQLEGASTTRQVAKAMIQEGRAPRDRSERMIYNNYQALLFVRRALDQSLTPEVVFELQRILTEGTLDDPEAAGRFRRADEHIVVSDEIGQTLHTPPPASQLTARLRAMCDFANGDGGDFIPPAVRAVLLHFWLAYDHPFVDGNGRTARALFYWSMARHGYWLCEFVSISRVLKRARAAYGRSFLYTETDGNDATYFILHQLRVLLRAIDDLHEYLRRKSAELRAADDLVRRARWLRAELNPRQLALVNHAMENQDALYTVESHRVSHGVSYETARSDLLALARAGLLEKRKRGRTFNFVVPADLKRRLQGRRPAATSTSSTVGGATNRRGEPMP
ncbi:MAG: Fic family protein [Gemmatimonadaceae bacterium]